MKTAITVLQEMMIKLGPIPEYECISQSGPQHQATFEYRCKALQNTVTAQARSKKEAKQEAARLMLQRLYSCGYPVPPPYNTLPDPTAFVSPPSPPSPINKPALEAGASGSGGAAGGAAGGAEARVDVRGYVALLKELCEQYRLGAVEFPLRGDTGPAHARRFTVAARLGRHERAATANTKKTARQLAAEQLYHYLRENLARLTGDFVEEEALARAHEKAMERYVETQDEVAWRPDMSQKLADYHLGLLTQFDEEARACVVSVLRARRPGEDSETALAAACAALGVRAEHSRLRGGLHVLALAPTAPPLAFAARAPGAAAERALAYLRRALAA